MQRIWIAPVFSCLLASALWARLNAETGVSDSEILLGSCAPLSGVNRALGQAELGGANAYIDHINRNGGVAGRKIRIVSLDDRYEVDEAIACFNRLLEKKVFAAAFFAGAPTAAKYVPMAESNKIPLVGILTGAKFVYHPLKRYVVNMRAAFPEEASAEAEAAWSELGMRRFGVIYQNDAFGASVMEGILSALSRHGAKPVAAAAVGRNSMAVGAALETLQKADPEIVFLALTPEPAAELARKARSEQWRPRFILIPGWDTFIEAAGPASEGAVWAQLVPPTDDARRPAIALFQKLMKDFPEAKPDNKSLEGFIHALVLVEGLRRAGKDPTREKLIEALESMRDVDLGLGPDFRIRLSPTDHQAFDAIRFIVVEQGKAVPLQDWKKLRR